MASYHLGKMDGITDSIDLSLSKLREIVKDRETWSAAIHGVPKSRTKLNNNNTYVCIYILTCTYEYKE